MLGIMHRFLPSSQRRPTPSVEDVFGTGIDVDSPSYVDRGQLDDKLKSVLAKNLHVVIHGSSKQGKTWLRKRVLSESETILVQAEPDTTIRKIFETALSTIGAKAPGTTTCVSTTTHSRALTASGEATAKFPMLPFSGSMKVGGGDDAGESTSMSTSDATVGEHLDNLKWVCETLKSSGRRLVIEDFHYLPENVQEEFAYEMKAMGEYGVFVIVIGVWAKGNLLTYFNGELDGRVRDIHLAWNDHDLHSVLHNGLQALELEMEPSIANKIVMDSYGNVGTLQRIAYELVANHSDSESKIADPAELENAERQVAEEMSSRYLTFVDNFVRGMRRMNKGLLVYQQLLKVVTTAEDEELVEGIDSRVLHKRLDQNGGSIRQADLTQALDRVDKLQAKISIRPPVLTYMKSTRRLVLADRSFLFYRLYSQHEWPWETDGEIQNDLAENDPLNWQD